MPRIFDNIEDDQILLDELQKSIQEAYRADFCVGYFNLRGWRSLASHIESWQGTPESCCRVLVGMQSRPDEEFREAMHQPHEPNLISNAAAQRLRRKLAEEFRTQLTIGVPTNADEAALRQLAHQLESGKVVVKLYLETRLHAKLYLLYTHDRRNPIVGFVGSSNLTMAGLAGQGELNVEVIDNDAGAKLERWFNDRWENRLSIDISQELLEIINESWAQPRLIPPYHVYIKMAYHLSQEARTGLTEFNIPKDLDELLFDYQKAAVKVAAHHLHQRGGVLIGDVVGLGKTLMATTLARIFEDDFGMETLILCPPRLQSMWQKEYVEEYGLRAKVLPTSLITRELSSMRRYRMVIIDESHNFRNRKSKTYEALKEYLDKNDSWVILLSATPYNKTYLDLSSQLRLFVPDDRDLGIRPEALLKDLGEVEFNRRYQTNHRSLAAFEKSTHRDDWRELMRLYMVRRTRSFIQEHYATFDPANGRKYLTYQDRETGEQKRSYFPKRVPRTLRLENTPHDDQYSTLYNDEVVGIIRNLEIPRYGLGQYKDKRAEKDASPAEAEILDNLSRAGKRLIGFSRTNLFKRLESSGVVFLQSLQRHILRNAIYLYAIQNDLPLPIGTQDIVSLDALDQDLETLISNEDGETIVLEGIQDELSQQLMRQAEQVYRLYQDQYASRFQWIAPRFFQKKLAKHLRDDMETLSSILQQTGGWNATQDQKLNKLVELLTITHPHEKVLIFTQFADTVVYLERELKKRGIQQVAGVIGSANNPSEYAYRFSPSSNRKKLKAPLTAQEELRVLIATDVLSEGQNLQDGHIVVNYDLAWAIIRLIQRAGRVDRIGQQASEIYCYSFLPADGIEHIIRLRERIKTRLQENAEVVGTDEQFFEDEDRSEILNLYNEHADILNEEGDAEVDLSSYALEIWNRAIAQDASLKGIIERMPLVVYATREHIPNPKQPEGALVYLRTHENNDLLAWVDSNGNIISESQYTILNAARCTPHEPALERSESHHEAVEKGMKQIVEAHKKSPGGQLGKPSGARFKTYERLKRFADGESKKLFAKEFEARGLFKAVEEIYNHPLRQTATDALNRQLKAGITDEALAELVMNLRDEERLCIIDERHEEVRAPRIICSMGLRRP